MKRIITFAILSIVSLSVNATVHGGFVNLKQCVYYKDSASHRSDCTNENTMCSSDGRCTVTVSNASYEGETENLIVLVEAEKYLEVISYEFPEDDILDLRSSKLKYEQIILE